MRPTAAAALLAGVSVAALLAQQLWSVGAIALVLLCVCLRAGRRARPYLWGTLFSAGFVFLLSPLLQSVGLSFAVYALLLDHDRLIAASTGRRSVLAAALATRLVPTLERDAAGLVEALRGRGLEPEGLRGHAALLSPLLAGSLERGVNLAEAMEARGFGRPGRTRLPSPPWHAVDWAALAVAALAVVVGALWL